jgi:hypothetical protein
MNWTRTPPGLSGSDNRTSRGIAHTRRGRFAESTGAASHSCRVPCRDSLVLEQAHQFSPHECRSLNVVRAATQSANRAAEIPSERAEAPAGQIREEPPSDVICANDLEWRLTAGQRTKERLLESREVDDRRRRLWREPRGVVSQLAPGEAGFDAVSPHGLGDSGNSRKLAECARRRKAR